MLCHVADTTRTMTATESFARRMAHEGAFLVTMLRGRRFGVTDGNLDPRFLVFEYMLDVLLRKRQVEMVQSFKSAAEAGDSSCQQMIMGAGKTTVIGPLLALCLANGDRLLMQVMPSNLLQMTRDCMRSVFSAIITKRIFTLEFERGCDDDPEIIRRLCRKLDMARCSRGVVCCSPENVKSLVLKFVEQEFFFVFF